MKTAFCGFLLFLGILLPAFGQISPEEQGRRPAEDAALYQDIPEKYRDRSGVFLAEEPTSEQSAGSEITYRLVNLSEAPIYFEGFSADAPLIRLQERKRGQWREWQVIIVGCVQSIGTSSLPPQKSILIGISSQQLVANLSKGPEYRQLTNNSRIGIKLFAPDKTANNTTIWSKP